MDVGCRTTSIECTRSMFWEDDWKLSFRVWSDSSVVKSTYCCPKRPKFSSQHFLWATYNCLLTPVSGATTTSGFHRVLHMCVAKPNQNKPPKTKQKPKPQNNTWVLNPTLEIHILETFWVGMGCVCGVNSFCATWGLGRKASFHILSRRQKLRQVLCSAQGHTEIKWQLLLSSPSSNHCAVLSL